MGSCCSGAFCNRGEFLMLNSDLKAIVCAFSNSDYHMIMDEEEPFDIPQLVY